MAWRFVKQPNGLLARFSEVVDDFTDYDMTEAEATAYAWELGCGPYSEEKVRNGIENKAVFGDDANRFEEAIGIVLAVHGREVAAERRRMLDPENWRELSLG